MHIHIAHSNILDVDNDIKYLSYSVNINTSLCHSLIPAEYIVPMSTRKHSTIAILIFVVYTINGVQKYCLIHLK